MRPNSPLYLKQLELEKQMHDGGIDRWHKRNQDTINQGEGANTDWNRKLVKHFIKPVAEAINSFQEHYEGKRGKPSMILQYMGTLPASEAAFITIRQMLNAIAIRDSTSLQYLSADIAGKIEDQVRFSKLKNTDPKTKRYLAKIEESLKKSATRSYQHKRNVWAAAERKLSDKWQAWPHDDKIKFGIMLIKLACSVIVMEDDQSGELEELFFIGEVDISRGKLRRSSKVLGVTAKYASWVAEFMNNTEAFHPEMAPCVIPPREWRTPFIGGFHTAKVAARNPLVKSFDREHIKTLTQAQMPLTYKAVNLLQRTEWKVNTEVLDVLQEICEKRLPLGVPDYDAAHEPINPLLALGDEVQELTGEQLRQSLKPEQFDAFITWKRDKRHWHDSERSRVSSVIDLGRTRNIAERYSEFDKFYFVYSLDFRQRFYPRAAGLSPQGNDIQKGLLRFANRKPLGTFGHFWLINHGAGLWGWDKLTFTERMSNAQEPEFKEMVKRIAADPIESHDWVKADKGEKSWQFLAWCFEYADYMKHIESGEPSDTFETFISCNQDGSCSGIQHYSALLRDPVGARSVNLCNRDKPQDIYGDVMDVVTGKLREDASNFAIEEPDPTGKKKTAQEKRAFAEAWLAMPLSRGLTKKPVMTLPYGSSQLTCRDSVGAYIDELQKQENKAAKAEEREPVLVHTFGDRRWEAEGYMSSLIWESIGEVVVAARAGMKAIRAVARAVALRNSPLYFTAPTGFVMKLQAFKTRDRRVNTVLLGRIDFRVFEETDELCPEKMKSGSAPDFIHTMDSSHLVFTVCDLGDAGVTDFWMIHDDFGTHACQTGELHKALRYQFVQMYQENWLENFLHENEQRLETDLGIKLPKMGDFDLKEVYESKYIFS